MQQLLVGLFFCLVWSGCISSSIPLLASDYCEVQVCITKTVHGNSMYPTIWDKDSIVIGVDYYQFHPLERGDIVVIDLNVDNGLRIKRIVGLQGDVATITPEGNLAINGAIVSMHPPGKPFTSETFNLFKYPSPVSEKVIPSGRVLAISDNIEAGFDSLDYGFVPYDFITGKVIKIIPSNHSN